MFTQEELKLIDSGLEAIVKLAESRAADRAMIGEIITSAMPPGMREKAGTLVAQKEAEMKQAAQEKELHVNALRGKIAGLLLKMASDMAAVKEENPFSDITTI